MRQDSRQYRSRNSSASLHPLELGGRGSYTHQPSQVAPDMALPLYVPTPPWHRRGPTEASWPRTCDNHLEPATCRSFHPPQAGREPSVALYIVCYSSLSIHSLLACRDGCPRRDLVAKDKSNRLHNHRLREQAPQGRFFDQYWSALGPVLVTSRTTTGRYE